MNVSIKGIRGELTCELIEDTLLVKVQVTKNDGILTIDRFNDLEVAEFVYQDKTILKRIVDTSVPPKVVHLRSEVDNRATATVKLKLL